TNGYHHFRGATARRGSRVRTPLTAGLGRVASSAACNCVYGSVPRAVASAIHVEPRSLPPAVLTQRVFPHMQLQPDLVILPLRSPGWRSRFFLFRGRTPRLCHSMKEVWAAAGVIGVVLPTGPVDRPDLVLASLQTSHCEARASVLVQLDGPF